MKTSKTSKIRTLLAKGMDVKKIAEKVGTSANYVYSIRWQDANKGKKKVAKKAGKKATKQIVDWEATELTTSESDVAAREEVSKQYDVAAREEVSKQYDPVNHPFHYTVGGIEVIDFIEAKQLNYNLGNVIKYVSRADYKNFVVGDDIKDLEKARWYLTREIEALRKSL